jgi:adenine-specific DNA-methyltransferase
MAKKDYSTLSKEQLLEVIEKLESKKKYGLVWDEERVPEKVVTDCQDKLPVLTEVKDKEITTDENEPTHIVIEGDNYHALSVLNYTHKGKIDLIYIDPPYNTGNRDFTYNDKYVEKEDTWRHSKWLSFMNKRLSLARELLTPKGIIFISIDDNEGAQLKLLCDEIYGEDNFLASFVWIRKKKGAFLSKKIRKMTEYVHCYQKATNDLTFYGESAYADKWQPIVKRTNAKKNLVFQKNTVITTLANGKYETGQRGNEYTGVFFTKDFEVKDGLVVTLLETEARYVWTQEFLNEEMKLGSKVSLSTKFGFNVLRHNQSDKTKTPSTLISNEVGVGTNEDASSELANIFKSQVGEIFSYNKPVSLIKYLANTVLFENKNAIVLDFFAGSGTTGQAILELNKNDGGKRKFIITTNNEVNNGNTKIADDVCFPRLKHVIKGYENLNGEQIEGLGSNLKYFKTSFVINNRNKDQLKIDITKRCTEMLCLKEGIFNLHKEEADYKIFQQGERYLAVYYDFANASLDELKDEMNALNGEKILYCFTVDNHGLDKANFRGWKNIRLEPIPQKILDVYKRIFKN